MKKSNILLVLLQKNPLFSLTFAFILILILFTHLLYLGTFPPGLAHDEVEYQLSSKTFAMHGTDVSGYGFPLNLIATETEGNVSPIPIMLLSLFHAFLPLSLFSARLPYFFLLIANAVALGFFVQAVFRNRLLSFIASLIFLINPWAFFLSRFATESPFALLFTLIMMTILLKSTTRRIWWALLFFLLAFFSYHAAKVLLLPLVAILLFYRNSFPEKHLPRINTKPTLLFCTAIAIVFLAFLGISRITSHSTLSKRGGDIMSFSAKSITDTVNQQRKLVITNPLTSIMINKYIVGIHDFSERYLTAFSPRVLFFEGDLRIVYAYQNYGLFYLIDGLFLLLGIIFLIREQPRKAFLLILLLLIAPLPSALNQVETSYVHRSYLLLPLLITIISYGIYAASQYGKRFIPAVIIVAFFIITYALFYANFLQFYFFRYPITSGEYYALDSRIVANFIRQNPTTVPIEIYTSDPRDVYTAILYYLNDDQLIKTHLANVQTFNHTDIYKLRNFTVTYGCPADASYSPNTTYLIQTDRSCLHGKNPTYTFNNPKDAGPMYYIYNSTLCNDQPLVRWKQFSVNDYQLESMQRDTFCQTWVSPF